jgi:hypothetical protein
MLERSLTMRRLDHRVASQLERGPEQEANVGLVIDNQHGVGREAAICIILHPRAREDRGRTPSKTYAAPGPTCPAGTAQSNSRERGNGWLKREVDPNRRSYLNGASERSERIREPIQRLSIASSSVIAASVFPLAVLQKYADDQGGYHAATITYYGFYAIFPLLLVLTTVLGFVLQRHRHLEQRIVDSALGQFPVIGPQLSHGSLHGSALALVLGLAAALWAGMGVFLASQNAMNHLWGVPFKRPPDPSTRAAVHSCCLRCSAAARSRRRSSPP